jgi:transposase-like protein
MNETIIKCDRQGRLRYSAEHKQALIEAYESSGLSGPKFAELHGVNYQTLVYWLKKRRPAGSSSQALVAFVPAELEHEQSGRSSTQPVEVLLPDGMRLAIHSAGQVELAALLIRQLQSSRPC